MAEGYPVVIKQFLQFCLIIIYPAWVFGVLFTAAMHALFYVTIYPVLWVLFWPMRQHQKKNHPEEYAESQREEVVGLFNSSGGAQVSVTPEVVRPRQTVTATVTTGKPIDKVSSATLEWGYTNFYRYRWAGRADSTAVR